MLCSSLGRAEMIVDPYKDCFRFAICSFSVLGRCGCWGWSGHDSFRRSGRLSGKGYARIRKERCSVRRKWTGRVRVLRKE